MDSSQVLLIDLGNTRIKWRYGAQGATQVVSDVAQFASSTAHLPYPSRILACVVGDMARYAALSAVCQQQWQSWPQRLTVSRTALGIHNHYTDLNEQGPDRWAAILGASQRYPQQNLLVISAGTALVVDTVTRDGQFLGGTISPGLRLMKQALVAGTARLPFADGQVCAFPHSTMDAIENGCQRAILGIILQAKEYADQSGIPIERILVFGGDAAIVQTLLNGTAQTVDNLVLDGLAALHTADDGVFIQ